MSQTPEQPGMTVYYDGSCALCRNEISFYQARRGAETIRWIDVSTAENGHAAMDLSCAEAMARFHVRLRDGRLMNGGSAFAALWRELPAMKLAGWLFAAPPLSWLLNVAYDLFLPIRPHLQAIAERWAARSSKGN